MSAIQSTPSPIGGGTPRTDPTIAGGTPKATGPGVAGAAGPLPEALFALFSDRGIQAAIDVLGPVPRAIARTLEEIAARIEKTQKDLSEGEYDLEAEKKKALNAAQQQELKDAVAREAEAEKLREGASIWDKVKLAFQALGAILMFAAGVALMGTGLGAIVGGLMIASALVMVLQVADGITRQVNESQGKTGGLAATIQREIMKNNPNQEEVEKAAAKADMIMGYTVAAVALVLAVATVVAGNVAAVAAAVKEVSTMANTAIQLAGQITSVTTALGDAGATTVRYFATESQAEGTKKRASSKDFEALASAVDAAIEMLFARLRQALDTFTSFYDGYADMLNDRGNVLAQASFVRE